MAVGAACRYRVCARRTRCGGNRSAEGRRRVLHWLCGTADTRTDATDAGSATARFVVRRRYGIALGVCVAIAFLESARIRNGCRWRTSARWHPRLRRAQAANRFGLDHARIHAVGGVGVRVTRCRFAVSDYARRSRRQSIAVGHRLRCDAAEPVSVRWPRTSPRRGSDRCGTQAVCRIGAALPRGGAAGGCAQIQRNRAARCRPLRRSRSLAVAAGRRQIRRCEDRLRCPDCDSARHALGETGRDHLGTRHRTPRVAARCARRSDRRFPHRPDARVVEGGGVAGTRPHPRTLRRAACGGVTSGCRPADRAIVGADAPDRSACATRSGPPAAEIDPRSPPGSGGVLPAGIATLGGTMLHRRRRPLPFRELPRRPRGAVCGGVLPCREGDGPIARSATDVPAEGDAGRRAVPARGAGVVRRAVGSRRTGAGIFGVGAGHRETASERREGGGTRGTAIVPCGDVRAVRPF